ncbi:MAG: hypothetical protein ACE5GZ_06270 [Gammaproteobacteria bacterium]
MKPPAEAGGACREIYVESPGAGMFDGVSLEYFASRDVFQVIH